MAKTFQICRVQLVEGFSTIVRVDIQSLGEWLNRDLGNSPSVEIEVTARKGSRVLRTISLDEACQLLDSIDSKRSRQLLTAMQEHPKTGFYCRTLTRQEKAWMETSNGAAKHVSRPVKSRKHKVGSLRPDVQPKVLCLR